MKKWGNVVCVIGLSLTLGSAGHAQTVAIPNASFENGVDGKVTDWRTGGRGETDWEHTGHSGSGSVSVSGQSSYWSYRNLKLEPNTTYMMSFWSKSEGKTSIVVNLRSIRHTFRVEGETDWKKYSFFFTTPEETKGMYLRLGRSGGSGKLFFDNIDIQTTIPLVAERGNFTLEKGESINENKYSHEPQLEQSTYSHLSQKSTAQFNTDRWIFDSQSEIIYRYQIGKFTQKNAKVLLSISRYRQGGLIVEASRDGKQWAEAKTVDSTGEVEINLPRILFPSDTIYVRLRTDGSDSAKGEFFQVNKYQYTSELNGKIAPVQGNSYFLSTSKKDSVLDITPYSLGDPQSGEGTLQLRASNPHRSELQARLTLRSPSGKSTDFSAKSENNEIAIPYQISESGDWKMTLQISQDGKSVYSATSDWNIPILDGKK